ncbi:MAG: DEAD/DEAH box helicase family protein [Patescibacteria group bacterium]|nr:DEAD/DEAH box helicase family protein [Patescibacteria group bacterium]
MLNNDKKFVRVSVITLAGFDKPFFHYENQAGLEIGQLVRVPFGHKALVGIAVGFDDSCDYQAKNILEILPAKMPLYLIDALSLAADYYLESLIRFFRAALPKMIRDAKFPDIHEKWVCLPDKAFKAKGAKQKLIIDKLLVSNCVFSILRELAPLAVIKNLEKKRIIAIYEQEFVQPKFKMPEFLNLTVDQEKAFFEIQKSEKPILLYGVTGSGKTELYLRLVAEALKKNQTSLMLVPEIAITPQLAGRFIDYFGSFVTILHSHRSDAERAKAWLEVSYGVKKVVVGSRSAIFAPAQNLGLIILDEYHDQSYKQDNQPLYDTRKFAEFLAEKSGAKLIFGSATPRVEDYFCVE